MNNFSLGLLACSIFFLSSLSHACGNNPNAIVQGPFKDKAFNNGYICFQNTPDKRDIEFHLSSTLKKTTNDFLVDIFDYSDAPVELMSVFFAPVNGERNVVVLLRWNVNYESNGVQYPYFYEIKTYHRRNDKYVLNLSSDNDAKLSGYEIKKMVILLTTH